MKLLGLSQRDDRWANQKLGFSVNTTIGQAGCVITAIAMKFGTTPDVVNEALKALPRDAKGNGGYFDANLVVWKKLEEALPGVQFVNIYDHYDNDIVLKSLPCIVEVDGTPIGAPMHWVLFIGNQKILDPWDGVERSTATYKPKSFVVLGGEYKKLNKPEEKMVTLPLKELDEIRLARDSHSTELQELKKKKLILTADEIKNFKEEIAGVIKAATLIQTWGIRWQDKFAVGEKGEKVRIDSDNLSGGVNGDPVGWFLKLFKGGEVVK